MTARPSPAAPILAMLAIGLVLLGTYVAGYFWLGEYDPTAQVQYASGVIEPLTVRTYRHVGLAYLFWPAAVAESLVTGMNVDTWAED